MKVIIALLVGIAIGAGGLWYYATHQGHPGTLGDQIESAAKSAGQAVEEKLRALSLRASDIKDELARTGRVVRQKSHDTSDAGITAAIKGRIDADPDLSVLNISVSASNGVVTMAGAVPSVEDVSKVMLLALDTDGVRQAVSTLQVKARR